MGPQLCLKFNIGVQKQIFHDNDAQKTCKLLWFKHSIILKLVRKKVTECCKTIIQSKAPGDKKKGTNRNRADTMLIFTLSITLQTLLSSSTIKFRVTRGKSNPRCSRQASAKGQSRVQEQSDSFYRGYIRIRMPDKLLRNNQFSG